jgi:hypothetical protein
MLQRYVRPVALMVLISSLVCAQSAWGRIKLITLPQRERVEIQLDHPDVTLVEEERIVPLVRGVNQVDFSWNNTRIDKDSIQFRALSDPDKVQVLSVSYPPGENALVWQVSSAESGPARVRITYRIGQLKEEYEYRAVATHDESVLTLDQYVKLHNLANEEFDDASLWTGYGERFVRPIGINETKQLLSANFKEIPVQKTYTCNPAEFGYLQAAQKKLTVAMHYLIENDEKHQLGRFPLMPGKVRIFQQDGRGGTAFIGEDWAAFTPVDDDMKLYLGLARDVVVKRIIEKRERNRIAGNLYDYDIVIRYEIENFKDDPVTLDITEDVSRIVNEVIPGDRNREAEWELGDRTTFRDQYDREKSTFEKIVFNIPLLPKKEDGSADKVVHKLNLIIRNEW